MVRQYIAPAAGAIVGLSSVYLMDWISEKTKPAHWEQRTEAHTYPTIHGSRLEITEIIKKILEKSYYDESLEPIELIGLHTFSEFDENAKRVYDNAVRHAEQTVGKDLFARTLEVYAKHPLIEGTLESVQDLNCGQAYELMWIEEDKHEKSLAYTTEGYTIYRLGLESTRTEITEQRPELAFYEFNNDGLVDVVKLDTEDNDTYLPVNFYGAMAWVADWHEKEFPSLLGNYNADTDCVPCIINAWSDEYALSIAIQLGVEGGIKLFSERYIESPLEENCDQSAVASSVFKQEHDEEGNRVVIYYDRGEF